MLPQLKAELLGTELNQLTRDDGARLGEILTELRGEVEQEPGNLIAATALVQALCLAGRASEARDLAQRNFQSMMRLPAVEPRTCINVLTGLSHTGQFSDIAACVAPLLKRDDLPREQRLRLIRSLCSTSLRTGDLTIYRTVGQELAPEFAFLRASGLTDGWSRQQGAIEARIGTHVAFDTTDFSPDDEGVFRLVLEYFTDAGTPDAVEHLIDQVDEALEEVYADHPEGPAVLLGKVVLAVHGPRIPLPGVVP